MGIFDIFREEKKVLSVENKEVEKTTQEAPKPKFTQRNWDNPSSEAIEHEELEAKFTK